MNELLSFIIPFLGFFLLLRTILLPIALGLKLLLHCSCGLLCLHLVNSAALLTIPVNAVTVLVSGTLGLPGIGLLALLEFL